MARPRTPARRPAQRTLPASASSVVTATPITSDQGWSRLMRAMSKTMPRGLHQTGRASRGLYLLTRRGV